MRTSGDIDVLIGTHRILSQDVEFKNLGLLIIDEEHRFGVKAKEKIKQLKKELEKKDIKLPRRWWYVTAMSTGK